ncbi:methyltetrahydrofolate cobalamin methyltransferase [Desulfofundulus sp. TPOSR]|uniref:methyltetrahydrofolate cobalamin methyltransferase n=1 Tax=Desulfofundulus sp. TPOSR TaxID=2714340 RepID=UPI00140D82A6|nr:methyltetrahydrofolate cobalamin methyltransferase [Desulfofundulus sp. TPOSR]NHM26498.1 methyltetrahydrofolate cobalamin methyltransferase [Desulfofundulus sp. TPOSR]
MLIVGELINTSRKPIKQAVENKDAEYIKEIARKQAEAGAHYIDVNCGTLVRNEPEIMAWLVNLVKEAVDLPLCIDSPNPKALEVGLELAAERAQPMVNSISAEAERYNSVLPLVLKYKAKVVALLMDDSGMPDTAEQRIAIVRKLVAGLVQAGVPEDDIYIDPLVKPVSTGDSAGVEVLETLQFIRREYPAVHTICGLSNISYGLPNRPVLNQVFLIQTMTAGMDAYILDPLDRTLMGFYYASQALLGKDPYCSEYLKAHRSGLYQKD